MSVFDVCFVVKIGVIFLQKDAGFSSEIVVFLLVFR